MDDRDTTLRLIAFAPADTLRSADSLRVIVVIRNGGTYRQLADDGYAFTYDVVTAEGSPVKSEPLPEFFGMRNSFSLGRGEFTGFTEHLGCVRSANVARKDLEDTCWWDFRLPRPGAYRIVAHYRTTPSPGIPRPVSGSDYIFLTSDTVRIEFRPRSQ
jgi:hypothetical protein